MERGTHDELLDAGGRYASMWEKQIRAERALDKAREATIKAAKAMKRANMGGKKDSAAEHTDDLGSSGTLSDNDTSNKSKEEECSSSSPSSESSDVESAHEDEHSAQKRPNGGPAHADDFYGARR